MLTDGPEQFVFHLVPDLGIAASRLVQKFHHHAALAAVAFGHVGPHLAGVPAGGWIREESLLLVRSQVKVVTRAFVQVQNHIQVRSLNIGQCLVQESKDLIVGGQCIALEQVEIVHRQAHMVEPRLADASKIFLAKKALDVGNQPRKTYGILFFDTVDLTEPATQIHSP